MISQIKPWCSTNKGEALSPFGHFASNSLHLNKFILEGRGEDKILVEGGQFLFIYFILYFFSRCINKNIKIQQNLIIA